MCEDDTTVDCITGTCVEGAPQIYVKVTVAKTFTTLVDFPGIPHTIDMGAKPCSAYSKDK